MRSILFNVLYRLTNGLIDPFETLFFSKTRISNKMYHIAGGFNFNILDHENCKKVQDFFNKLYQNGMIPTINNPARVTRKEITTTDHFLTKTFLDRTFKSGIFISDVSDHLSDFSNFIRQQTN